MTRTTAVRGWLALLVFAWANCWAASVPPGYGKVVLPFEPNLGQTDARARFIARSPGVQVFVAPAEATYRFDRGDRSAVVRMALVGANRNAAASGSERLPGESHYLAPGNPITRVPHYARVEFAEVYRGIDLAYYGNGSRLEYDFIVAPGADPRRVAIDVEGARQVRLDKAGRLVVETLAGPLVWEAPLAYQDRDGLREIVPSRYVLRGRNRIAFEVAKYDRELPLTIDPVLAYSTLVGGSGHDRAYGIAVDINGEAVITGEAGALDYPTTPGVHDRTSGGVFVTRLNASGSALVYSTFLGGGRGTAIALRAGQAYVTGATTVTGFATPGAYVNPAPGQRRAFVARLSHDGSTLMYGAVLGPQIETLAIAVDAAGAAYVTGTTTAAQFPTTVGAFQPTRPTAGQVFLGDVDAFLVKLDPAGSSLLYSTYLGSTHNDFANGIAVDANGRAYVAGMTLGRVGAFEGEPAATTPFPTTAGAYQTTFTGIAAAFVTKFDPTASGAASVVYSTLIGDGGGHLGRAIAVDAAGSAYVTGVAEANFPLTAGAYGVVGPSQTQPDGSFVAKLNAAGNALVYAGMIEGVTAWKIAIDGGGRAFVTGLVDASNTFAPVNGLAGIGGGSLFLTKLDAQGATAEYSTYLPGHLDNSVAVAVDVTGQAYVSGTAHVSFMTTPGAYQSAITGSATEAFVLKVATNRPPVANAGPDQVVFAGQSFTLDGSASFDPDGDAFGYAWSEGTQQLSTSSSVSLTRSMGAHTFRLTVSDGAGGSSDEVVVTVRGALTVDIFGGGSDVRVASSDGLIDCTPTSNKCFASYDAPTAVTLTATPGVGWSFLNWSNACSGAGFCTVTVNGNVRVGAHFGVQQVPLTVTHGGNGVVTSIPSGIQCGSSCSLSMVHGSTIQLSAQPDPGYRFTGWGGDCAGAATTCTLTLTSARSASASFQEITLDAISISPASAAIALGGRQRFTIIGTFSDGTTRPLSADRSLDGTDDRTCAITRNGSVKCFGGPYAAATTVAAFQRASMLAAGTAQVCALFGDGTVNCEGTPMGLTGVTSIAASAGNGVCALMADATLQCWDTGAIPPGLTPLSGGVPPVAIAADAGQPACAVLADGRVSCVGYPAPVAGIQDAIATAVGVFHACALLADGRVKCWGDNDWGQLGRGTTNPISQPQPADFVLEPSAGGVTTPIGGVTAIVSGDYHMCALGAGGTVWCWGQSVGAGGQGAMQTLAKVVTSGVTLGSGSHHACATDGAGALRCWGFNLSNTLGQGTPSSMTPVTIPGMTNILTATWSSSATAAASIAANGIAAGRSMGSATIVATVGGLMATATLNIVNTPVGSNVEVTPVVASTGTSPVSVTFSAVTQPGETTVVINPGAPPGVPTSIFGLGSPSVYYDISTTATYTPPIEVCIDYTGISFSGTPALFHMEAGVWTDVTTNVDLVEEIVCGQVSSLSPFALLVHDKTGPVIATATATPAVLWPANHKMVPVTLAVSATDRSGPVRCRITSVGSNEPVNGTGDGDTAPDWQVTGDLTLLLRAERAGNGKGRVYRIEVRCEDAVGNATSRALEVVVPLRR